MIDFNWTEITVLAVLAMILFGPEKLPEFARKAARVIAHLRKIGNDARGQLRAELGPEWDNVRLSDLNPKNFVARHLLSAEEKDDLLAIRDEFRSVGAEATEGLGGVREGIEGARSESRAAAHPGPDAAGADAGGTAAAQPDPASSEPLRVIAYDPEAT
nr:Sec-independent protein translocase subunit TatB [Propionibacterium sp.]